jgi:membrane-associated phospholipid phosphatase
MDAETPKRESPIERVAFVFSTIGNPLLTSALLLGAACLRFLNSSRALEVGLALLVLLLLPIALWNFGRVRSGHYSDFDVSRREDRGTLYPLIVGLPLLAAGILFVTGQPASLWVGMLCAGIMTAVAASVNRYIKISLHAAFSFYYAVAVVRLSPAWVAPAAVFAVLVACSRFILKRHAISELVLGTALGLGAGTALILTLRIMDQNNLANLR